jgi:phosphate transport system permease protein
VPLFAGTLLISAIAMLVAVPVGLISAIYLANTPARFCAAGSSRCWRSSPASRPWSTASSPRSPWRRCCASIGTALGLEASSESALAAGLVMGVMIIPFVSSLSDDMITAVPLSLRDGAYALGATRSETIKQVVLPAALPGIVGGVLLAVRAPSARP